MRYNELMWLLAIEDDAERTVVKGAGIILRWEVVDGSQEVSLLRSRFGRRRIILVNQFAKSGQ